MSDTTHSAVITFHPFVPRERHGKRFWWDLCECGFSEAAHARIARPADLNLIFQPSAKARHTHSPSEPARMDCPACFTKAHAR